MMKNVNVKRILYLAFIALFSIALILPNNVYAEFGSGLDTTIYGEVTANDDDAGELMQPVGRVLATVVLILQICAVAGVVFMGVKYMYAASEDKAKIKQTLIWLIIGTIFVFAAPTIINFISNSADRVI